MTDKIKKLKIDLLSKYTESEYNKDKAKFIAGYTKWIPGYTTGSWFSERYVPGRDEKDPVLGEAKWNEYYPDGYNSWVANKSKLTGYGEQLLINKINELVEVVNKLSVQKSDTGKVKRGTGNPRKSRLRER